MKKANDTFNARQLASLKVKTRVRAGTRPEESNK